MTHESVLRAVIDLWKRDPDPSLLNNTNAWILWIKRYTYQNKMSDNPSFKSLKLLLDFIDVCKHLLFRDGSPYLKRILKGVSEDLRQQILAVRDAHENNDNIQLLDELRKEYAPFEEEPDPIYMLYANGNTIRSPKILATGKPLSYHMSESFYSPCEVSGRIMDFQKAMPSVEETKNIADGEKSMSNQRFSIRTNADETHNSPTLCPGILFKQKPNRLNESSPDVSTRLPKMDGLYLPRINNLSSVAKSLVKSPKPDLIGLERPPNAPELTNDILNDLRRLRLRSPDDIIVSDFSMQMLQKDLMLFYTDNELLIDKNIDFYLHIIRERSKADGFPTVFVFRSVFYPILNVSDGNYDDVKNATENEDIFCYDMVFFPVIYGQHWRLVVLCPQTQSLTCFDSVEHNNAKILRDIASYLQYLYGNKITRNAISEIPTGDVSKEVAKETEKMTLHINPCNKIPLQTNSTDCGVFLLLYAEYLSRRQAFNFTQSHIPYFRKRITYEVMQKSIL